MQPAKLGLFIGSSWFLRVGGLGWVELSSLFYLFIFTMGRVRCESTNL